MPRDLGPGAISDLWRRTLSQIPSVFGRLLYLSGLRDPNTARYEHHGFVQRFGESAAQKALTESHDQVFEEWLLFNLEEKKADLELYLSGYDRRSVLEGWSRLGTHLSAIPAGVAETERRLYVSELEALLALLRNEAGVVVRDPDE